MTDHHAQDTSTLPAYVVAHVQDALAADPRVGGLGVEVTVAGDRLFLTGTVPAEPQRVAAAEVAHAVAPHLEVCNDLELLAGDPHHGEPEHIA